MPDAPLLEIDGISLRLGVGELAVLNDSSTQTIDLKRQKVNLWGDDISDWGDDLRLDAGLFMTTGQPAAIPGISANDLVQRMPLSGQPNASDRHERITDWCARLDLDAEVINRPLNADFTPSEAARVELLQAALLQPKVTVLNLAQTDGDQASRGAVVTGLQQLRTDQPDMGVLVVTSDDQLTADLAPDYVITDASTHNGRPHRDETLP